MNNIESTTKQLTKIFLLVTFFLLSFANAQELKIGKTKTVNILFGSNKPPFVFGTSTLKGSEIDIVKEAFKFTNYTTNISQGKKDKLEKTLHQKNNIDAVATISKKNDGLFYSDTISVYENYVITRKEDNIKINSIEDLKNINFVIWKNGYKDLGDKFYKLYNPHTGKYKKSYHDTKTQKSDMMMFFSKKVDAIIVDKAIFNWYKMYFKESSNYTFYHILKTKKEYPVALKDKKIRDDFNIGLRKLKKTGRYDQIIKFYQTQNIQELMSMAHILSDISSKYLLENNKQALINIFKKLMIHPDIKAISIKKDKQKSTFINLVRKGDKIINKAFLENKNLEQITSKIYYKTNFDLLYLGDLTLYYKKDYQTNKSALIPSLKNLKSSIKKEYYEYLKAFYKKYHLQEMDKIFTKDEIKYIKNKKNITICSQNSYAPFVMKEDDEYKGISIDFLQEIVKKTNLGVKYIQTSKSKNCDISTLAIIKNNKDKKTTTIPYIEDEIVVVTTIDKPYTSNLNDLKGKRFLIKKGDCSLKAYVQKIYPNIQLVESENIDFHSIIKNQYYGYIGLSYCLTHQILKSYPNKLKVMTRIGKEKLGVSYAIKKENPLLLNIVNKSLQIIAATTKEQILSKYKTVKVERYVDYTLVWQIFAVALIVLLIVLIAYTNQRNLRVKIEELNNVLEDKVKEEVEKNRLKDKLMFQQSRLAQMGEMISMIAHQWRQPLNNLSMLNQSIVLKYKIKKLDDEMMEYFKLNSKKQITQMSQTIDDFRDFFKPEKEKIKFSINDLIDDTIDIIKPFIDKNNINLTSHCNNDIVTIGYQNELGQVIINIINNAKDALLDKEIQEKNITIECTQIDENILIKISDNAGGIPENIIDNIFDPYFSTKEEKNGTGLGLYMSKVIVEEHMDGELNIKNISNGACFEIILRLGGVANV